MSRNGKHMNALECRKQLLIAESDLNRIQLTADKAALHTGLRTMNHGATTFGAIAATAAVLATQWRAIPRTPPAAGAHTGWLHRTLYGAGLISSVWLALLRRKP